MLPIAILVAGQPVPSVLESRGGFDALIRDAAGTGCGALWHSISARGLLPDPTSFAGAVVTGSPDSVTEQAAWMLEAQRWLRELIEHGGHVLGICFGQQLVAAALGGRVEQNPRGLEMGTVRVRRLAVDPLLEDEQFMASTTHRDSMAVLPSGAMRLAETEREPCAAVRFAQRVWGVQFHPEIDAAVMRQYIAARREIIERAGLSVAELEAGVTETPCAARVIPRFLARVSAS